MSFLCHMVTLCFSLLSMVTALTWKCCFRLATSLVCAGRRNTVLLWLSRRCLERLQRQHKNFCLWNPRYVIDSITLWGLFKVHFNVYEDSRVYVINGLLCTTLLQFILQIRHELTWPYLESSTFIYEPSMQQKGRNGWWHWEQPKLALQTTEQKEKKAR